MSYSIRWNPKPLKFVEKLPKEISIRITEKLDKIVDDPFHYLEHYEGRDYYKLRVGDYRLLIDVDLKNKVLFIRVAGHRSKVYERL